MIKKPSEGLREFRPTVEQIMEARPCPEQLKKPTVPNIFASLKLRDMIKKPEFTSVFVPMLVRSPFNSEKNLVY
jgi:hypothetical protein